MEIAVTEGEVAFHRWTTWYRISGAAGPRPPLICLHGGPGSTHNYFGRLEELAAARRPVIVYDQVGCGASSRPAADELSVELFVRELANLTAHLGIGDFHLLGTSWGGVLALEYVLGEGPPGLLSLVLSSTLACARSWAGEAARLRDEMPPRWREALTAGPAHPLYHQADKAFEDRHICRVPDAPERKRMQREKGTYVYEKVWGPNEWTITGDLNGWDVRHRLREIDVPVLITAGVHDLCTTAILRELQQGLPHARTVVFASSSHMPYLEEPVAYHAVVGDFLDGVDAHARG